MHIPQKKLILIIALMLFVISPIFLSALTVEDLLEGYAQNDITLRELNITLQQSILEAERIGIENGINVELSGETMEFDIGTDGTDISVSPELQLTFPFLNDATVTASAPFSVGNTTGLNGASVDVSVGIISDTAKNYNLDMLQAERSVELAKRNLRNHALSLQTSFWEDLKSLYNNVASILQAEDDLIEEQLNFEIIKTQGYVSSSVTYRTTELTVKTAEWTVEEAQRLFQSNLADFLVDCGFTADAITELPQMPSSLDTLSIASIADYNPQAYTQLEESMWSADFNRQRRDASGNFSLNLDAGYDHNALASSSEIANNASVGLSANWDGLTIQTGISVPITSPVEPTLMLGLTWNMNNMRLKTISDAEKLYLADLDNLEIASAQESLQQEIQSSLTQASNLEWQRSRYAEELLLYEELFEDTKTWYEQGIVSALDALQSKTNYEQALYQYNSTLIDVLIYNLELSQLFIEDISKNFSF
ncbi:MAG: TolC family protein [Spirochaetales bacterium]